jgi:hypothetical protein
LFEFELGYGKSNIAGRIREQIKNKPRLSTPPLTGLDGRTKSEVGKNALFRAKFFSDRVPLLIVHVMREQPLIVLDHPPLNPDRRGTTVGRHSRRSHGNMAA